MAAVPPGSAVMLTGKADTARFAQALQQRAEDLARAGVRARRRAGPRSADARWRDAGLL